LLLQADFLVKMVKQLDKEVLESMVEVEVDLLRDLEEPELHKVDWQEVD
jgi:hypothetical protein